MATIRQTLEELMTCDGAMCAAVVDFESGMMLGSIGSGNGRKAGTAQGIETFETQSLEVQFRQEIVLAFEVSAIHGREDADA